MQTLQRVVGLLICYVAISGLAEPGQDTTEKPIAPDAVVLTVDGQPIEYQEIRADPMMVRRVFAMQYGHEPDPQELQSAVLKLEMSRLVQRAKRIVFNMAIEDRGIEANADEIKNEIESMRPALREEPERVLEEDRDLGLGVVKALEAVIEDPDGQREAYEEFLRDLMPYETWRATLELYDTAESRQQYLETVRSAIPQNVSDLYKALSRVAEDSVLAQKLRMSVVGAVEVSDEELARYYKRWSLIVTAPPPLEQVKEELRQEAIEEKRRELFQQWFAGEVADADIRVGQERFNSLVRELEKSTTPDCPH